MQNRHDASAFRTNNTGVENGEVLGRMMPWASMASHWRSSSSFCSWGYRYGRTATGGVSGSRWMRWSYGLAGGSPRGSSKMAACCSRRVSSRGCWAARAAAVACWEGAGVSAPPTPFHWIPHPPRQNAMVLASKSHVMGPSVRRKS